MFWVAIPIYLALDGLGRSYWAPEGVSPAQIILTFLFLNGFWPSTINGIVPGGWSIVVEMTFYAMFPFIVSNLKGRAEAYLMAAMATYLTYIVILQPFIMYVLKQYYITQSGTIVRDFLHLNFLNQLPVFLIGCALFFAVSRRQRGFSIVIGAAWCGCILFMKYVVGLDRDVFGLVYLAIAAAAFVTVSYNVSFLPVEAIGRNSYSIYLLHFAVLYFLSAVVGHVTGPMTLLGLYILTVLIAFGLSTISKRLIEDPLHRLALRITASP
jgi:peptidoglycan/LPS O-acetylase OafA/YrhL